MKKRFNFFVFIFFIAIVFIAYRQLFQSYFEADEWFHFTYYLPLTRKPDGFLTALVSTFINAGPLSGGQHLIPIASAIFFLNTKFFGLSFPPYAFMSLLLHGLNSFLVFLLIKTLLSQKQSTTKNIFAILGSVFFALVPTPMHAVTGAAPFYGQNVLSVTFFLLCVVSFKQAYISKAKKFVYLSILFLFLSLFTKETSVFLFLLLPFMAVLEKRIFPMKFLSKLFLIAIIVYSVFRFLVPNFFSSTPESIPTSIVDTETIVSRDLAFHKNLPGEVILRTVTFPVRMTGTLFLPRQTTFSIVELITPIVVPFPDSSARLSFLYGAGNFFVIYLVGIGIIIFCLSSIFGNIKRKKLLEANTLTVGFAIIVLSALPLVAIIFSFPRWGYDFYFDSRFYYNPNVGAALIFPFLLFGISKLLYKSFKLKSLSLVTLFIFLLWLANNMYVFGKTHAQFVNEYGLARREIIKQLKSYLPSLKEKTVFYMETDGQSAFGPNLPFFTSVPQAITVVYYDKDPLPDGFFDKPLFNSKAQGYQYLEGRGFGYYTSKKDLAEALAGEFFSIDDVYGFYYYAQKVRLKNITPELRQELANVKK